MRFLFGDYALDLERRELRRGADLVEVEPQVFDLLAYLVANRDRVASKDDLLAAVWHGRIVSGAAQPRRRPLSVRAGAVAGACNPQCPVRCARKPQQRHPVARAGMATLRRRTMCLFG